MKHTVTVLAISRKWGGKCVAGYDHSEERFVRLVKDDSGRQLDNYLVNNINLLDIVEVDVQYACPRDHQTENLLINTDYGIRATGATAEIKSFESLIKDDSTVFGNARSKLDTIGGVTNSLELVKFREMTIYVEDDKTKADFYINDRLHRWYRVTDLLHEGEELTINNGYAVISLPPADDYAMEHGFYKYIAAIFPEKQD